MYKYFVALVVATVLLATPAAIAQGNSSNLSDRLQVVVTDRRIQLSEERRARVVSGCRNAQELLRQQASLTSVALRKRQQVVNDIQLEILALKLRMTRQGVDASELELLRGKLQQRSDELTLASDKYGRAVSDAQTVDCVARPEQFVAALELTREARSEQQAAARHVTATLYDAPHSLLPKLKKRLTL